jgi:hypothetical protein
MSDLSSFSSLNNSLDLASSFQNPFFELSASSKSVLADFLSTSKIASEIAELLLEYIYPVL